MTTTHTYDHITDALTAANDRFLQTFPGDSTARQPVHTVYGGAQLFKATTTETIGRQARQALQTYAPTAAELGSILEWTDAALTERIYARVAAKLTNEAVEDFRIDFEDGYGTRPDDEEDAEAQRTASELAKGYADDTLPSVIGIRIKPFTRELASRGIRTLSLFISTLVAETGGTIPPGFVVTLPKVTLPEQVTALVQVLEQLESDLGLDVGTLRFEIMVETPQALIGADGFVALPRLIDAGGHRITGVHFGTYDYTALSGITAAHQTMAHPACDLARGIMQIVVAQRGIGMSDGATNIMPIGPHRAAAGASLSAAQVAENQRVVHGAWRTSHAHIRHSLEGGIYQGWDLHPAQLPVRYATVYQFFLEGFAAASERLRNFVAQAAQATLVGDVFDDAATGQGLLNYFLRARACGAITEEEALETGLTLDELQLRSFPAIVAARSTR